MVKDWASSGLKVGLEIHQQLDTDKLFCRCPSVLEEGHDFDFERELRVTQSELGEVDRAALEQARRHLRFRYLGSRASSCLVEMDEEPPHEASARAVRVGLQVARMLQATVVDEIQVMRKIVIDGSNTSGFQRTALLAHSGVLQLPLGDVTIQSICLEEDAARKIDERDGVVTYKLDRLGIPLLEIATGPDIRSPEHARDVAFALGQTLRATGNVKRGLGTIRQDLNISIRDGARVEVKGVQELRLLPIAVEREAQRQQRMLEIRDRLRERHVHKEQLRDLATEVGHLFRGTGSQLVEGAIRAGGTVLALRLRGFAGLLGKRGETGPRLGAELAQYAKIRTGVRGIFQSDELPDYGIVEAEVARVREAIGCAEEDAFVLVAEERSRAAAAMEAVRDRAILALAGVPEETREILAEGSTTYLRPLPGSARMYPETDVPPFSITLALLREAETSLPELPEAKEKRLLARYGLGAEEVRQLIRQGWADAFEAIANASGGARGEETKLVARVFLSTIPELEKEGVPEESVTPALVAEAFSALRDGRFAKEAIPRVLSVMAREGKSAEAAAAALGLRAAGEAEVRAEIRAILDRNAELLEERGERALSALMGDAMKALRGRADGGLVSRLLKEEMNKRLVR